MPLRSRLTQAAVVVIVLTAAKRASVRWGVTDAEVQRTLPGDELIPSAGIVMDRACTLECTTAQAYPWLVQLGKGRAGWYLPLWVDRALIPVDRRAARHIDPALQDLAPGDRVPDWGRGNPELEVISLDPPGSLVFVTRRGSVTASWTLQLEDAEPGRCRLHARLRANHLSRRMPVLVGTAAGLFDLLTLLGLFAGLRERVSGAVPAPTAAPRHSR
ncbi:hypothetical protein [Arthrobacter sp. H5]|uniref:hypothetical protein n=1 Tax=Arthrobacter sp. H5 TaxID=1267973 RepID=UPI0004B69DE8|nr:hypothetical protein [Arthrobacter sp. H5]